MLRDRGRAAAIREHETRSLAEVHRTVPLPPAGSWLRRMFAFAGPAYLVSVGYMDPGNWATDLAGGARFGYRLVWVLIMSNLMAVLLQTLSARLGVVTGKDLAQACRDFYPKAMAVPLWLLCEVAIVACDLAEVLGAAIGLELLFGVPLLWGVLLTGFDVLLLLALGRLGMRRMEALIVVLVATIGVCFAIEMLLSKPGTTIACGISRLLKKGVRRRCERRGAGCKEARRGRCRGASERSADAADGPAPPQPLAVAGLLLPTRLPRRDSCSSEPPLQHSLQKARHDARIHFSAAC